MRNAIFQSTPNCRGKKGRSLDLAAVASALAVILMGLVVSAGVLIVEFMKKNSPCKTRPIQQTNDGRRGMYGDD